MQKTVSLISNKKEENHFKTLQSLANLSVEVFALDEEDFNINVIIGICSKGFNWIVFTDGIIDGFHSRNEVAEILMEVKKASIESRIIIFSHWRDTEGADKPIFIEGRISPQDKCKLLLKELNGK